MNVKDYIESGILEAYILGALSEQEMHEVEANIALYPELKQEMAGIEATMQRFAESTAKEPPAHLQDKIWSAIQQEAPVKTTSAPTSNGTASKTIPLPVQRREMGWQRAAIWVGLIGSLAVNTVLWSQRNDAQQKEVVLEQHLDTMKTHIAGLEQQGQQLAQQIGQYQQQHNMLADTAMQTIVMRTAQPGHPMAATVYWSKNKGEAYVSLDKLPMPPKGMQYQMWVIDAGKPVDLGMFENSTVSVSGMQKLSKLVTSGQVFAISLEKAGGSPTPTMANIYVLGKVS